MSAFDRADARLSKSIDRLLSDEGNVIWRPQRARTGGTYTQPAAGTTEDPDRPVRTLNGIIVWRPDQVPVEGGANSTGGGTVFTARLLVDVGEDQFTGDYAAAGKPKRFDRFELPFEPNPGDRHVVIDRIGDDGGVRLLCWCSLVK